MAPSNPVGEVKGADLDLVGRIRPDVFKAMDWQGLLKAGLVHRTTLKNKEVEKAFAGTAGEGLDAEVSRAPGDVYVDLYTAHLNVPTIGKNPSARPAAR